MSIVTTLSFVLQCIECGKEVHVGECFDDGDETVSFTLYPDPMRRKVVGMSQGTGDTFHCVECIKK